MIFFPLLWLLLHAHCTRGFLFVNTTAEVNLNTTAVDKMSASSIIPVVIEASMDTNYTRNVSRHIEYIFVYQGRSAQPNKALLISVSSVDASTFLPVLFVVRQQRNIISWIVPQSAKIQTLPFVYHEVNRTVCESGSDASRPLTGHTSDPAINNVLVGVSTNSPSNLSFSVLSREIDIGIKLDQSVELSISPTSSGYLHFSFPASVEIALIRVQSADDLCATVRVRNVSCPMVETPPSLSYGELHQTMTYKSGITVRKSRFPSGLLIEFHVLSDDAQCGGDFQHLVINEMTRNKHVRVQIQETIPRGRYLTATFGALAFCGFFYVVTIVVFILQHIKQRRLWRAENEVHCNPSRYGSINRGQAVEESVGDSSSLPDGASIAFRVGGALSERGMASSEVSVVSNERGVASTSSDTETNPLAHLDPIERWRSRLPLHVADLARKRPDELRHGNRLFSWHLVTVAIFYGVPVVQLVVTYQKILNQTGDQDSCYYNFLCAHPLGILSDFNHVFSNVGYVALGLLFLVLVKRRELIHQRLTLVDDAVVKSCGIPRHFGLFYAMGLALMMEGVLSACYHVCPSKSNFQFDTAFMYVIAVLSIVRIYETRHADINASSNSTFLLLAFAVLVGVVGVLQGGVYFWVMFTVLHLGVCMMFTVHIYYLGHCNLAPSSLRNSVTSLRLCWSQSVSLLDFLRPAYPVRLVLLLIANLSNTSLAIFGVVTMPRNFATFLLAIFISNLLLYTFFYIVMKLRYGETLKRHAVLYITLCFLSWGAAIYFFLQKAISWQVSPAESRVFNRDCLLLDFYDSHDIWHFLSATSLFFGFMVLLTWDDDLELTPRDQISVF